MRINLDPDHTEFVKQVAAVRRHLNGLHMRGGADGIAARFMTATFVPYMAALRSELRDNVVPTDVLDAAADLIANLAKTTVQSLIEAPAIAEGETVEQLLIKACHVACGAIAAEAEAKKPKLSIVPKTMIHMRTEGDD